jgi:Flp pilus assembly protein TadD
MLIRPKSHWATLLAIGLPLLVGGCATGGMPSPKGPGTASTAAAPVDALTLADRLKAEGNLSSAASMYQQAHQANPADIRPLLGLAECLLGMGANADAANAYGSALSLQPGNLDALRGLGHTRILMGQPQFAVTQYETALNIAPNDVRALNGLGVAKDMIGEHAAAQQAYKRVLSIDANNQAAKNNLALSLALSGNNAEAIKILDELSKSSGSTTVNRQNLALVYGASGQFDQARQVSRADLPEDAVAKNMATMANADETARQEMLKRSLGVELKGRQYAPAAKPVMPLTNLAQAAVDDRPVYLSGADGGTMPVITTEKRRRATTTDSAEVAVKPKVKSKSSSGDAWSDDWDEELVDATDLRGIDQPAPAAPTPEQPSTAPATTTKPPPTELAQAPATSKPAETTASQRSTRSPFLSAANAIADDKSSALAQTSAASATEHAKAEPVREATKAEPKTETATADAAPVVTAKTVATAKIYTVQLASYRSEAEATAGWRTLSSQQAELLGKLPHSVAKADLGADKGIYYRLQAGAFDDRKDATALCSDLKSRAIDCMVVEAQAPTQQSMNQADGPRLFAAR